MTAATTGRLAVDGATIVSSRGRRRASLYVEGGRVVRISDDRSPADTRVDASGLYLLPGFIDAHVHLMEPAAPEREDWPHGTAAAAGSGVTTIVEHTHSSPVRSVEDLRSKLELLRTRSRVDYALAAHAWPGHLDDIDDLWSAGIAFFKVFTCTTHGVPGFAAGPLLELFRRTSRIGAVCLVHCEDESITSQAEARLRADRRADGGLLPEWRSREAEEVAVEQVLVLSRLTGARVTIAHASESSILLSVMEGRRRGANAVAETCPQYLTLLESEVDTHRGLRKFTPPARARTSAELAEMWRAVSDSQRVAYVSSDHAPSTIVQKEGDFWSIHFGLPGLDTTSSLLIDAAAREQLSLERLVEIYAETPAMIYELAPQKGFLSPDADADFVLVSLAGERAITDSDVRSKAAWSPYSGRRLRGRVVAAYLRGMEIFREGKVIAEPGLGRFVPRAGRETTGRAAQSAREAALRPSR